MTELNSPETHIVEPPNYVTTATQTLSGKPLPFVNNSDYYVISHFFEIFNYFGTFWSLLFNFLNYIVWLRITDEGSVPEMRIWSISLI